MPTIISHAVVPLAIGLGLGAKVIPRPLLLAGVVACMLPDADVAGMGFVEYGSALGHRGVTHSLLFAALLGTLAALCARWLRARPWVAFVFVMGAAASHGLLDMLTNGGSGVALFWPFTDERYFFPARVIEVSPIGITRFLTARGATVALSELLWVWLPGLAVLAGLRWLRRR